MPRKSKKQRIASLIKELNSHSFSQKTQNSNDFYPFSNDNNIYNVICQLANIKRTYHPKTLRVSILVGESFCCSLLAVLDCDLIVFNDKNSALIHHVKMLLYLLKDSVSIRQFIYRYELFQKESPIFDNFTSSEVTPNLKNGITKLKEFHFLSSSERFEQCQRAAKRLSFAFCQANFFDQNDVDMFFNSFNRRPRTQITFCNFTNLHEWDAVKPLSRVSTPSEWQPRKKFTAVLERIKCDTPIIMASHRRNNFSTCPLEASLFFACEDYVKHCQTTIKAYLHIKFQNPSLYLYLQTDLEWSHTNTCFTSKRIPTRTL